MFESDTVEVDYEDKHPIWYVRREMPEVYLWAQHFSLPESKRNGIYTKLFEDAKSRIKACYTFLDKTQIFGMSLTRLGIPNICGEVSKQFLQEYGKKRKHSVKRLTKNKLGRNQLSVSTTSFNRYSKQFEIRRVRYGETFSRVTKDWNDEMYSDIDSSQENKDFTPYVSKARYTQVTTPSSLEKERLNRSVKNVQQKLLEQFLVFEKDINSQKAAPPNCERPNIGNSLSDKSSSSCSQIDKNLIKNTVNMQTYKSTVKVDKKLKKSSSQLDSNLIINSINMETPSNTLKDVNIVGKTAVNGSNSDKPLKSSSSSSQVDNNHIGNTPVGKRAVRKKVHFSEVNEFFSPKSVSMFSEDEILDYEKYIEMTKREKEMINNNKRDEINKKLDKIRENNLLDTVVNKQGNQLTVYAEVYTHPESDVEDKEKIENVGLLDAGSNDVLLNEEDEDNEDIIDIETASTKSISENGDIANLNDFSEKDDIEPCISVADTTSRIDIQIIRNEVDELAVKELNLKNSDSTMLGFNEEFSPNDSCIVNNDLYLNANKEPVSSGSVKKKLFSSDINEDNIDKITFSDELSEYGVLEVGKELVDDHVKIIGNMLNCSDLVLTSELLSSGIFETCKQIENETDKKECVDDGKDVDDKSVPLSGPLNSSDGDIIDSSQTEVVSSSISRRSKEGFIQELNSMVELNSDKGDGVSEMNDGQDSSSHHTNEYNVDDLSVSRDERDLEGEMDQQINEVSTKTTTCNDQHNRSDLESSESGQLDYVNSSQTEMIRKYKINEGVQNETYDSMCLPSNTPSKVIRHSSESNLNEALIDPQTNEVSNSGGNNFETDNTVVLENSLGEINETLIDPKPDNVSISFEKDNSDLANSLGEMDEELIGSQTDDESSCGGNSFEIDAEYSDVETNEIFCKDEEAFKTHSKPQSQISTKVSDKLVTVELEATLIPSNKDMEDSLNDFIRNDDGQLNKNINGNFQDIPSIERSANRNTMEEIMLFSEIQTPITHHMGTKSSDGTISKSKISSDGKTINECVISTSVDSSENFNRCGESDLCHGSNSVDVNYSKTIKTIMINETGISLTSPDNLNQINNVDLLRDMDDETCVERGPPKVVINETEIWLDKTYLNQGNVSGKDFTEMKSSKFSSINQRGVAKITGCSNENQFVSPPKKLKLDNRFIGDEDTVSKYFKSDDIGCQRKVKPLRRQNTGGTIMKTRVGDDENKRSSGIWKRSPLRDITAYCNSQSDESCEETLNLGIQNVSTVCQGNVGKRCSFLTSSSEDGNQSDGSEFFKYDNTISKKSKQLLERVRREINYSSDKRTTTTNSAINTSSYSNDDRQSRTSKDSLVKVGNQDSESTEISTKTDHSNITNKRNESTESLLDIKDIQCLKWVSQAQFDKYAVGRPTTNLTEVVNRPSWTKDTVDMNKLNSASIKGRKYDSKNVRSSGSVSPVISSPENNNDMSSLKSISSSDDDNSLDMTPPGHEFQKYSLSPLSEMEMTSESQYGKELSSPLNPCTYMESPPDIRLSSD